MLKLAGRILDVQDDAPLTVLRKGMDDTLIVEKFASGEVLEPTAAETLDDPQYAAIFHKEAQVVRRAYPVGTAGQTLMSVEYFSKVASAADSPFPEAVRNQIACNLSSYADLFQVTVPDEMRKWASAHGEFLPNDNWVDVRLHDSPELPPTNQWAIVKTASDGEIGYFPCGSKEEIQASLHEMQKNGGEPYGLDPIEERIAAANLMAKAAECEIEIPDAVRQLGSMEKRAAEEIHGMLLERLERVPMTLIEAGENKVKLATALKAIEEESDPVKMAGAIAAFDAAVDFGEGHYLTGLMRPHEVVFQYGAAAPAMSLVEKIGEDRLREYLGDDAFETFRVNPSVAFAALPREVREGLLNG
jgi:hypothetical protein